MMGFADKSFAIIINCFLSFIFNYQFLSLFRNCLNFINENYDDFIVCDEARSGVLCNEEHTGKELKKAITGLFYAN